MIIRNEIFSCENFPQLRKQPWQNAVFYDIETTGLGWRSSHIYLIGALFFKDGNWILRQWFLDRPFAEKEMLADFSGFLQQLQPSSSFLTDYNGDTFDLPYLRSKFRFYDLPLPDLLLPDTERTVPFAEHVDLLRKLRPLKTRLGLPSLRLQDVEAFLRTQRTDASSGKELIEVYYQYLQSGEDTLLEQLFLHNHDDVAGLPPVVSLLAFSEFWEGNYRLSDIKVLQDHAQFRLLRPDPFPVSFSLSRDLSTYGGTILVEERHFSCTLQFDGTEAILTVPVIEGERKLFFKDYKNYYYLPGEDQAIHKSVGMFTDPAFRKQAKASSCYQRVSGSFVPFPSDPEIAGMHSFFREYKDSTVWIRTDDLLSCDPESLHECIQCILDGVF